MQQALRVNPEFEHFATVTLGRFATPHEYRQAINARGMDITELASSMLPKVECSREPKVVCLVKVEVSFFGFHTPACCGAIYTQAAALGLELCPAEVGLALMLQYPERCVSKCLLAMNAMPDPAQGMEVEKPLLSVFGLQNACGRMQLFCSLGHYSAVYDTDAYFIFARV